MSDLISRKTAIERAESCTFTDKSEKRKFMDWLKYCLEQPPVEAVPVVHGEWIHVPSSDMATGKAYKCSNCKKMRYGSFLPPFCQMCGADMRKKV